MVRLDTLVLPRPGPSPTVSICWVRSPHSWRPRPTWPPTTPTSPGPGRLTGSRVGEAHLVLTHYSYRVIRRVGLRGQAQPIFGNTTAVKDLDVIPVGATRRRHTTTTGPRSGRMLGLATSGRGPRPPTSRPRPPTIRRDGRPGHQLVPRADIERRSPPRPCRSASSIPSHEAPTATPGHPQPRRTTGSTTRRIS